LTQKKIISTESIEIFFFLYCVVLLLALSINYITVEGEEAFCKNYATLGKVRGGLVMLRGGREEVKNLDKIDRSIVLFCFGVLYPFYEFFNKALRG